MMTESNHCPNCGQAAAGMLDGLCPACIARFSFGLGDSHAETADEFESSMGDAPSKAAGLQPRSNRFGSYELLDEVGRGGMGIVYRARQVSLNRIVAVKMIPFGPLATEESVRRFRAEAEAAAHLQHPNIIAVHEIGEHDGQHYFSMDYVEGGTLADALSEGPWPAARCAAFLQIVVQAVHYAHQRGILHRDLKPSNILIDPEGNPRVSDFGLARRWHGDSSLTLTGQMLGSPNYMPPEQASAKRTAPAPASDIYSLGAMLYHMMTGRPPFQAESVELVLTRLTLDDPVLPRLLNPSVPADLQTICLKCLEKDPARRYPSAAELAEELGRFIRDEPILAQPIGPMEKAWRWCRRRPALASVLTLLFLVIFGGAAGVLSQWWRAESAGANTRRNLYAADMALAYRAWAQGDRGRAQRLLENHSVDPRNGGQDLRGWEWRYLWQQCQGEEWLTLGRLSAAVVALDYSRDGKLLAAADVRGGLCVWDPSTHRLLMTTNLAEGRISALAFSPDGSLLAHTTARRRVVIWDTRGWRQLGELKQADVSHLSFAPDGKTLATANGLEVLLWNVETRTQMASVPPSRGRSHPRLVAFAPDGHTLAVADANGVLIYWDYQTGTEEAGWRAHRPAGEEGAMEDLSFSPVGRMLATAGDDRSIRLWTAPQRFRQLSNHTDVVTSATFSRDGRTVLSSGMDQTVRWWDVATQRELRSWQAHPGGALRVRFAPDGRSFASSGVDGAVKLWKTQPPPEDSPVRPLPSKVEDVMVFSDPPVLALTLSGKEWRMLALPGFEEIEQGRHSTNFEASLKGVRNGRIVECSGPLIQFQRVKDGGIEPFITSDLGDALGADFSRDGRTIGISAVNGLSVWDVPRKEEIRRWLTPREGWGRHVRISPDGSRVVTLHNQDGTLTFFDVMSGRKTSVAGQVIGSAVLSFSVDGRWVATAGRGAPVRVFDVAGAREVSTFEPTGGAVVALAFSPDARRVACGLSKGLITLWDLETRREVAVLAGHVTMIYSMAFLDSDTFVSATREEVRLWRAPGLDRIRHQTELFR